MVACQSENNVPVVGRDQVIMGRDMHWMRIDRYYVGDPVSPKFVFQPIMCQHCENAPCETVCPVLATVHNDEGINTMIYNRCVGTRYCANNCPYKVRRFNYFEYSQQFVSPLNMALNPDMSTRGQGVMEKCTFCFHRARSARLEAKGAGRILQDGDVQTACQESCPSNAIVFGDLNDPSSQVRKQAQSPRGYHLLAELNVRPQVTYLTKIRHVDVS
jgi:molybdopterin-containing oxidoreductase family iron-sulfur binding subunit